MILTTRRLLQLRATDAVFDYKLDDDTLKILQNDMVNYFYCVSPFVLRQLAESLAKIADAMEKE